MVSRVGGLKERVIEFLVFHPFRREYKKLVLRLRSGGWGTAVFGLDVF